MTRSTASLNKGQLSLFKSMLMITVNRRPSDEQINALLDKNLVLKNGDDLTLTDLGLDQLGRLGFFAGLFDGRDQS